LSWGEGKVLIEDDLIANVSKITPEQYKKVLEWWEKHQKDAYISTYSTPWKKHDIYALLGKERE